MQLHRFWNIEKFKFEEKPLTFLYKKIHIKLQTLTNVHFISHFKLFIYSFQVVSRGSEDSSGGCWCELSDLLKRVEN